MTSRVLLSWWRFIPCVWVTVDYISPWVSVCCAVPILGFLEPLVEARCSTTGPKVSFPSGNLKEWLGVET